MASQTVAVRVEIRSGLKASHLRWLLSDLSELTGVRPGTGVLWRVCVCESEAETREKGAPHIYRAPGLRLQESSEMQWAWLYSLLANVSSAEQVFPLITFTRS